MQRITSLLYTHKGNIIAKAIIHIVRAMTTLEAYTTISQNITMIWQREYYFGNMATCTEK